MKILHVLVVLVISPLGFREDLHGHNYVFSVLSKCIYIQCCDQNKVLLYSILSHITPDTSFHFIHQILILLLTSACEPPSLVRSDPMYFKACHCGKFNINNLYCGLRIITGHSTQRQVVREHHRPWWILMLCCFVIEIMRNSVLFVFGSKLLYLVIRRANLFLRRPLSSLVDEGELLGSNLNAHPKFTITVNLPRP